MEAMHRASCGARATGIPRTTRSSKSRALPSHTPVSPEAHQALSLGFYGGFVTSLAIGDSTSGPHSLVRFRKSPH